MKKKVLVYPASGYGLKVMYHLNNEYEVLAVVDEKPLYIDKGSWGGVKVIPPSEIKEYDFDLIIISIAKHEEKIRVKLNKLGVPEEKVTVFCPDDKVVWMDERFAMARACLRNIKERNIQGNIAELGVYKGEFSSFLSLELPDRMIYLFDTFEGFSGKDLAVEDIKEDTVFRDTSVQLVLENMPAKQNVIIKKGWFPETASDINDRFCFVSLDADLYKPIITGLEFFYPKLEHGGYIFVHDFESVVYPGCKKAVLEFCNKYNVGFVPVLDMCSSIIITK